MYYIESNKMYELLLCVPSFSERYSELLSSKKKNILYIKEVFDPSTFRYRAYNVKEAMSHSKNFSIHYFLTSEISYLFSLLSKISIVVFQRAKWSYELDSFIQKLKSLNIKIVFDIDDLIYMTKYIPGYINGISDYSEYKLDSLLAVSSRLDMVASSCDYFFTTTDFLKNKLMEDYHKEVFIYHNFLNKEQEIISKEIVEKRKYSSEKFIIGYFSGSNSHKRDLEILENDLIKLFDKYDDVYLKIVGLMDLSSSLKEYYEKGRILIENFVPYEELQYKMASVDLNIIPLRYTDFNACKSELKYFEASIVGTITCATDAYIYHDVIQNKKDGFLCDNMNWFNTLEYIYLNKDQLSKIRKNALEKCYRIYGVRRQQKLLESIYQQILF